MADINLVIKMDEDIARGIIDGEFPQARNIVRNFQATISDAIRNGKLLPKGHGRLIDADRLKIDNPLHLGLDIPYVTEETVEDIIDHAPTIIEADKK